MIQIVKKIYIKIADQTLAEWSELSFVPATATIKIDTSYEDAGILQTSELKATLPHRHPWLFRNLLVNVILDDGETISIGTIDIPVRFSTEKSNAIVVSFKHKVRADV